MPDRFIFRMMAFLGGILLTNPVAFSATSDPAEQVERERAAFLCGWYEGHAPSSNPMPLEFCQRTDVSIETVHRQVADWWGYWSDHADRSTADALEKGFEEGWRQLRRQQQAAAESSDEKDLTRNIHKESVQDLCDIYRADAVGADIAFSELQRRKVFSANEFGLVRHHQIQIGMSERSLVCSWGLAEVNDTVTQYTVHKQYVYHGDTFVYVDNGRVTSYQSRTESH
jgi:hypothetical protein